MKHQCSSQQHWRKLRVACLKINKHSWGRRQSAKEESLILCIAESQDIQTHTALILCLVSAGIAARVLQTCMDFHQLWLWPINLSKAFKCKQYLLWSPCRQEEPEIFWLVPHPPYQTIDMGFSKGYSSDVAWIQTSDLKWWFPPHQAADDRCIMHENSARHRWGGSRRCELIMTAAKLC